MYVIILILLMITGIKIIKYSFVALFFLLGFLFGLITSIYKKYTAYKISRLMVNKYQERKKEFIRSLHLVE
jgi:cytochrome b subunit of formate dehydrogenase